MKKLLTIIATFILCLSLLVTGYTPVLALENGGGANVTALPAQSDDSNFTNLIVFARFADEDEFINDVYEGATVRQITENSYNAAAYNVADYYRIASGNKLRMNNVYLMDDGGSLQLSRKRGYYAEYTEENPDGYPNVGEQYGRAYDLREDWGNAVNRAIEKGNPITNFDGTKVFNYGDLDKNGDGKIDSITVIYKNPTQDISVGWASPLWNYQEFSSFVELKTEKGDKLTSEYYVQLTNSYDFLYRDSAGNAFVTQKVMVHELGHILGLKDLYNSSMASPIYYLSAMAKAISPVPQDISIKEKEALGWVNNRQLPTISADGTYTLKVSGTEDADSIVGYKMDIPDMEKTLYLEYRDFSQTGNKYDAQPKSVMKADGNNIEGVAIKSGLVCYLANSNRRYPDNMGCNSTNWDYKVLGGSQGTKTDAALAVGETLQIDNQTKVTVTQVEGDMLTFQIEGVYE